ncbi:hypothetical protein AK812_SmicGene47880, partial [Symbiodinium microadriaticum]
GSAAARFADRCLGFLDPPWPGPYWHCLHVPHGRCPRQLVQVRRCHDCDCQVRGAQ